MIPFRHLLCAYLVQFLITSYLIFKDVKIYIKAQVITFILLMVVYLVVSLLCLE